MVLSTAKGKLCQFWVHTSFVDSSATLVLAKPQLDKACKNKALRDDFAVHATFAEMAQLSEEASIHVRESMHEKGTRQAVTSVDDGAAGDGDAAAARGAAMPIDDEDDDDEEED